MLLGVTTDAVDRPELEGPVRRRSGPAASPEACHLLRDDFDGVHDRLREADEATIVRQQGHARFGTGVGAYAFTAHDPEGTRGRRQPLRRRINAIP